jgi:hypothetical protein
MGCAKKCGDADVFKHADVPDSPIQRASAGAAAQNFIPLFQHARVFRHLAGLVASTLI